MNAEQRKSELEACIKLAKNRATCRSETVYVIEMEVEGETAVMVVNGKHAESGKLRTFDGVICYSDELHGFLGTIHHAITPDGQVDVQCPPLGGPR